MNYNPQNYYGARNQPFNYSYQNYQNYPNFQQPISQPIQQPVQQVQPMQALGLQGKSVDSIDVVKAMDIPLDGSISYFPLTDGSAIVSKQLQIDGTSRTVIYEPVKADNQENIQKYLTSEELNEQMKVVFENNGALKDSMGLIKEEISDLSKKFKELIDEVKSLKGGKK